MCTYTLPDRGTIIKKADQPFVDCVQKTLIMHIVCWFLTSLARYVRERWVDSYYTIILNLISVCWYQIQIIQIYLESGQADQALLHEINNHGFCTLTQDFGTTRHWIVIEIHCSHALLLLSYKLQYQTFPHHH